MVWWALSFIGTSPRLLNWSKAKTKKWWTDITSRKQLLQITWSKISKIPALLTERLKWMSHTAKRKEKRTIRRCFEKPVWVFPGCVYTTKREMLPEFRSMHGTQCWYFHFPFQRTRPELYVQSAFLLSRLWSTKLMKLILASLWVFTLSNNALRWTSKGSRTNSCS